MKENNLVCNNCGNGYYRSPSKSKGSKFCSASCRSKFAVKDKKVERTSSNCEACNKAIEVRVDKNTKFCNRVCYEKKVLVETVTKSCPVCNKKFNKKINRETKYCSKECLHEAQSSGYQNIPSNGRMGFRKDLNPNYFFKSSLEADYARWCNATNKKYIYEHKTFTIDVNGKSKKYTPDFYHPEDDIYIETKAMRIDRKFGGNLNAVEALKKQGINIRVLPMNEFYTNIKLSNHYWTIDNIENKNYLGTRHLIYLKKS